MTTKLSARRGYFDSGDGLRLYAEHDPVEAPRARLVVVHGFAEHCGRYRAMCARFVELGFACHRFDLRGHGNSAGRRGHVYRFEEFVGDLDAFLTRVADDFGGDAPVCALAHSNGALVAVSRLLRGGAPFDAVALSSPFFDFAIRVPAWKKAAARALSKYVPAFSLPTDIPPEHVSHDPATIEQYGSDPLIGKVASARWLTETEAAQAAVRARAGEVVTPMLVQLAGDDRIASAEAVRAVFAAFGAADKRLIEYPGLFHEVWFEAERARVYADLEAWLTARYPTGA